MKPRIAVTLGDPAGVGPEIAARLLADPATHEAAEIVLVADPHEAEAAKQAGRVRFDVPVHAVPGSNGPFRRREATAEGGRHALAALGTALELVESGGADAILFAPLNKTSLHLAGMTENDELHWFATRLGYHGPVSELNVLDRLWTSRVTSHVPHRAVAGLLTPEGIADAVGIVDGALRRFGHAAPRIAVCGLNPHNGDGGNFGDEEGRIIEPGVVLARSRGLPAEGPFPADTVFVRARTGAFDAVVTMYHDQGQIAMKLLGFDRGVTVAGGIPVPIATPAHGTAFDIVGECRANMGAIEAAFRIACRMGAVRRAGPVH